MALDPQVVTLRPVVCHPAVVELLLVLVHELRHLPCLLPPHVLPQELQPVHIFDLGVQPADKKGVEYRAMIKLQQR